MPCHSIASPHYESLFRRRRLLHLATAFRRYQNYAYASRIKSDLCFCSSKPNYSTTEPRAALPLFLQTEQCFADTVRILSYPSRIATYLHRESLSHCLAPLNFTLPFRDASLKRSATTALGSALLCLCLSLLRLALLCLRRTGAC